MFKYLLQLIYPNTCLCCHNHLVDTENFVCTLCLLELPATNFHLKPNNDLEKVFWGRVNIERAIALLFYKKGGKTSKILHALKYHDTPEIAEFLGRYYGTFLKDFVKENNIEAVVAIPLHKKKLYMRGYNQSEKLAAGMAETLGIENLSKHLIRTKFTETQTKKSRLDRSENVNKVFEVNEVKMFENKHVLLIDDVITTGATIDSCAAEMLQIYNCKVSVAGLAFAYHGV
ncbi:MAG: ComF family protein [Bacteroidia bacterium]